MTPRRGNEPVRPTAPGERPLGGVPAQRIPQPWGEEIRICDNDRYALRIFEIRKGARVSRHYHTRKIETLYVDAGSARYWIERPGEEPAELILRAGDVIEHHPFEIHRQEALEDLRLIEVCTPPMDDIVRIEDDYGRADGVRPGVERPGGAT